MVKQTSGSVNAARNNWIEMRREWISARKEFCNMQGSFDEDGVYTETPLEAASDTITSGGEAGEEGVPSAPPPYEYGRSSSM